MDGGVNRGLRFDNGSVRPCGLTRAGNGLETGNLSMSTEFQVCTDFLYYPVDIIYAMLG